MRIDFETIEDISYLESVSSIKDFDVKRKNTSQKMEVKINTDTNQSDITAKPFDEYIFINSNNNNKIVFTNNCVFFDIRNYIKNIDMLSYITELYDNILKHIDIKTVNRIGLRYINVINGNKTQIKKWIHSDLLHCDKISLGDTFQKKGLISKFQYNIEESTLNIVFGRSIGAIQRELSVTFDDFILDYDCHNIVNDNFVNIDIKKIVKDLHRHICTTFKQCIKDDFRTLLNQ